MRTLTLPDDLVDGLERRAERHGRTLEAEHRAIVEAAVGADALRPDAKAAWIERTRQLREETRGQLFTPSEVLIRDMRDER